MKHYLRIGILVFLATTRVDAQTLHQALASGGGNASGATGSVSYTIGQTFYTTTSGASGLSAAGIQTTVNLGNPLPIVLVDFTGMCTGGNVQLHWRTAVEINNDYFTVEKSADANNWTTIATIKGGQPSKTYSHIDEQPATPVSYYRLKQTDLDGTYSYSSVIHVVDCAGKTKAVALYPNPTATGVNLAMEDAQGAEYELYDTKGILLRKDKLQNGKTYIDMSLWAAGTYFLKLRQDNVLINTFSILKN